ncbi:MAG TPA: hypothetical protein ENJ53_10660 [Phaeodactylibacter sp.]|nr:hypothetical protein [Phaeodactylibacter sp.]
MNHFFYFIELFQHDFLIKIMLFWYIRHETAVYEIRIVMREGRNNSYLLDVCRGGNNSVRSLTGVGFGVIGK